MAKIIGAKEHSARLRRIAGPEMVRQLGAALYAGASLIAVEAQISLTRGAVSGKGHFPSKPGEPPNQDTGFLGAHIGISGSGAGSSILRAEISSNAPYSRALEFGTWKMLPRPFMEPASRAKRREVVDLIRRAAKKISAGGKVVP